jgi:DNA polymerase-1
MKLAMLRMPQALTRSGLDSRMLLQVHDELVFECPAGDTAATIRTARPVMEGVLSLSIPLTVDVKQGENWEEMRDAEA